MLSYKAGSISNIVPQYVQNEYPNFMEFMGHYYDWQLKSTVKISSPIGSMDVCTHFKSVETDIEREIEVVVEPNESYITTFDDQTFVNNEQLFGYTYHNEPVDVDTRFNTGDYIFNGSENPLLTLFIGQQYFFKNKSGRRLFFKTSRTVGSVDQIASVQNNGTDDENDVIVIQATSEMPSLIYYNVDGLSTIGTITLRRRPVDFPAFPQNNVSVFCVSAVNQVFYHPEYLYNNFDNLVTINAPDQFFQRYLKEYGLERFFSTNFRNRRALVDFLRFFRSKGTKQSIKFFFQNFFQKSVELRYPGEQVLKPSDSEFFVRDQLFVKASKGLELTRNRRIRGLQTGTIGIIESFIYDTGRDFYKVYLDRSKTAGVFRVGESVSILDDLDEQIEYDIEGNIIGTVKEIEIVEPGLEYSIGQVISNSYNISGSSILVELEIIDVTHTQVSQISLTNGGTGYEEGDIISFAQPEKKLQFTCIVDSDISNQYVIPVTFEDTSFFTLNLTGAFVNIGGRKYRLTPNSTLNSIEVDESFPIEGIQPVSLNAGQLLVVDFPFQNVIDPRFDNSYFHPSNSVTKRGAFGYVERVNGSGTIEKIKISNRGLGYIKRPSTANGSIIISTTSGTGAELSVIGTNFGGVKELRPTFDIVGVNFDSTIQLRRAPSATTEDALLNFISGPTSEYGKFFVDNKGFLSDQIYLHDSFFYQDYSYVIQSDLNLSEFSDLFRELAHPAGMIFFNEYIITNIFRQKLNRGSDVAISEKTIIIQKTPDYGLSIDFSLITVTSLTKIIQHVLSRQLLREFRWESQTLNDLYEEYDTEENVETIEKWETITIEDESLIPRLSEDVYHRKPSSTYIEEVVTGTGTISYSDSETGNDFSDFGTVTGVSSSFTTEVDRGDLIIVSGETLLVNHVLSDTELLAQRINTTTPVSIVGEVYEINQRKKSELENARFSEFYQYGDYRVPEFFLNKTGRQLRDVFLNN